MPPARPVPRVPFGLEERKALVLTGAAKNLAVAVATIEFLPADFGRKGLLVVAAIVCHFISVLMDAAIVVRWALVTGQ